MKPHAFWTVTGVCYAARTEPGRLAARSVENDLVWIVATCLTPEEAIAVRGALVDAITTLVTNPAYNSGLVFMTTWLAKFARDPYLMRNADTIARRMLRGATPSYDVYRSYDDYTKIAELVTGEESAEATP